MPNVYVPAPKKLGKCQNCYGPIQGSAAKRFCSTYLPTLRQDKCLAQQGEKKMTSKFQQRHFEAIAEVLQYVKEAAELRTQGDNRKLDGFMLGVAGVEGELVRLFRSDNHLFDAERFHRACQQGANVRARTR